MQKLEVLGANKLKGQINISGSKNASLPILAATLLSCKKIYLDNYHGDSDKILKKYGNYPIKNVYIVKERLNSSLHINIMDYFIKNFLKKNLI